MTKRLKKSMANEAMTMRTAVKECLNVSQDLRDALGSMKAELQGVRDFAMSQQEQLRKYEDGYAWMAVKALGMRLIRCVDQINGTIQSEGDGSKIAEKLADVRDELVYALEAQGVESIVPELGVPFRGQEQQVKVVDIANTDNVALDGTIANVDRCGYWVEVADKQYRLIRPAEATVYKLGGESNG
jgi:molecular chaperone GrpE (heat shock protein)